MHGDHIIHPIEVVPRPGERTSRIRIAAGLPIQWPPPSLIDGIDTGRHNQVPWSVPVLCDPGLQDCGNMVVTPDMNGPGFKDGPQCFLSSRLRPAVGFQVGMQAVI